MCHLIPYSLIILVIVAGTRAQDNCQGFHKLDSGPHGWAWVKRGVFVDDILRPIPSVICFGNSLNPHPLSNFLVFKKEQNTTNVKLSFLGTQSLNGHFRDFTDKVDWKYEFSNGASFIKAFYTDLGGCSNLTSIFAHSSYSLLGIDDTQNVWSSGQYCDDANKSGGVFLLTGGPSGVVDDNGRIAVVYTGIPDTITLWSSL
ncbi:hypothetical protein BV898_07216 [Hypsibius exemplaris]|uniref:Uncharacterized protein n=1 Tax=Hypsibius exemplaris TaxID=2072580 RepID=A0A1W0WU96_HYPEX|nr:hypothetical protein BV898_07216 [Hypsibius exemplaris]